MLTYVAAVFVIRIFRFLAAIQARSSRFLWINHINIIPENIPKEVGYWADMLIMIEPEAGIGPAVYSLPWSCFTTKLPRHLRDTITLRNNFVIPQHYFV